MGTVVHLRPPPTLDEAWDRYIALVDERNDKRLWGDAAHNKQLSDAWQAWSDLYQAGKEQGR